MVDKKLTDNEIIKALECVPKDISGYIIDENNKMKLVCNEDVLDLINRQKAENAVLNRKLTDAYLMIDRLRGDNDD